MNKEYLFKIKTNNFNNNTSIQSHALKQNNNAFILYMTQWYLFFFFFEFSFRWRSILFLDFYFPLLLDLEIKKSSRFFDQWTNLNCCLTSSICYCVCVSFIHLRNFNVSVLLLNNCSPVGWGRSIWTLFAITRSALLWISLYTPVCRLFISSYIVLNLPSLRNTMTTTWKKNPNWILIFPCPKKRLLLRRSPGR